MSSSHRVLVLPFLALAAFALSGCGSWINRTTSSNPCANNGNGSTNRQAPIVCVDDSGPVLSVRPDPVTVHDRQNGSNRPVTMQWFTTSGANLSLTLQQQGCVNNIICRGGKCTAQTIPGADAQCKYDVATPGKELDPIIIITPCCS